MVLRGAVARLGCVSVDSVLRGRAAVLVSAGTARLLLEGLSPVVAVLRAAVPVPAAGLRLRVDALAVVVRRWTDRLPIAGVSPGPAADPLCASAGLACADFPPTAPAAELPRPSADDGFPATASDSDRPPPNAEADLPADRPPPGAEGALPADRPPPGAEGALPADR